MPLLRAPDRFPDWCELEGFEIVRLGAGAPHRFERRGRKEKLFVGEGNGTVAVGGTERPVVEGDVLDLDGEGGSFEVTRVGRAMTLVHAWGRWGEETGGSGVFTLENSRTPRNVGDPADYPRWTDFDRHYHDCDEYWILFAGRGLAVSEGVFYRVVAGDCVATRRGDHHDFPVVLETVRGVYLETTLKGQKRLGHLWEHTHGPAQPASARSSPSPTPL